jgi:thymidylate synthase
MYKAIHKPNQLIYGTGDDLVIVTGWTPKEAIAKKLASKEYAAIGNLYSPSRGINFLIRNLLLNPQITQLRVLSTTREDQNSGSCKCLFDFFKYGITQENNKWEINSKIKGYLDIEITKKALEELRNSITVTYQEPMGIYEKQFAKRKKRKYYEFEIKESKTAINPSNIYSHTVTGKTIADTWVKIIHRIRTNGTIRPTGYDGKWQELIDLKAIITDEPSDFYFPTPNYLPVDQNYITNYLPQMLEDAPYKEGVKYTYGQRLRSWFGKDQIKEVIDKLKKETDSASAVMNLWDSGSGCERNTIKVIDDCGMPESLPFELARYGRNAGDSDHEHGGSPCLNHIWVRIIDNKLSMTATFRSNDMFSAWVANAMGLRALQVHIRDNVDSKLELAPLITISQSAHIYDDCFENADSLIETQYYGNKKITYADPVGNFIIEYDQEIKYKEKIKVLHLDKQDNLIKEYYGQNPLILIREIAKDNPSIDPLHIGYLGLELEKVSQQKENYKQDV